MSTMTKVFIVLTTVFAITLSVLTISGSAQSANYKQLAEDMQVGWNAAFVERANTEASMYVALAMKDDQVRSISGQLADAQKNAQKLSDDLASARNDLSRATIDKVAAEAGRKKLEEILGVTTGQLTTIQKDYQTILAQNIELQTRNQKINGRLLELNSNLTIASDQIRNLQEKLYTSEQQLKELQSRSASGRRTPAPGETPTGVAAVAPPAAGPIRGEIVDVNGNYASINVGDTSGVSPGMTFLVHRGDTYVAELVIDTVWPKQAGGKLRTVSGDVRQGDRATFGM